MFDRDRRVRLKAIQVFICLYSLMPSSGVSLALQTTFMRHIGSTSREDSERVFLQSFFYTSELVIHLCIRLKNEKPEEILGFQSIEKVRRGR